VLDAPAEVSLVGLRRSLRWLTGSLSAFPGYLVDVSVGEDARHRMTPLEVCRMADSLHEIAAEAANHARLVAHCCEVIWDQAAREAAERRQWQLDHPEA
jgi:hypothetical protein